MVQEVGFAKLQALGIKLVAADSPHSFLDDTLKGARERKRALPGLRMQRASSSCASFALVRGL